MHIMACRWHCRNPSEAGWGPRAFPGQEPARAVDAAGPWLQHSSRLLGALAAAMWEAGARDDPRSSRLLDQGLPGIVLLDKDAVAHHGPLLGRQVAHGGHDGGHPVAEGLQVGSSRGASWGVLPCCHSHELELAPARTYYIYELCGFWRDGRLERSPDPMRHLPNRRFQLTGGRRRSPCRRLP